MAHGGKRPGAGRKSKGNHLSPAAIASIREQIKSRAIIKKLNAVALGEIEMTQVQVNAARILLSKVVPDLSAVTLSGNPDAPLVTAIVREIVNAPNTDSRRVSSAS